jgi:RNA polymerase sigma factor, sigma-70 family
MSRNDELAWIAQCVLFDDQKAYSKLVAKYQPQVYRFFMAQTLGDASLSDDLSQDTFIKMYLNLRSFKGLSAFSTWLFRIAYNVYYDHIRAEKPTADCPLEQVDADMWQPPENLAVKVDLVTALQCLRAEERTAVSLFYMEDLPIRKVSRIMGVPEGLVKSLLYRAKEKLAVYLKNTEYEYEIG